jgi:predicted CopG family antitoxin
MAPEKREKFVGVRLSVSEERMLQKMADDEGLSLSDMLRQLIRRSYKEVHGKVLKAPAGTK